MKRSVVFAVVVLLGVGIAFCGCGPKPGGQGHVELDGGVPEGSTQSAPDMDPAEWSYQEAPAPPIEGSPDYRLVSFGFERDAVNLGSEARGACREAVKKLTDAPDAKLAVIGFADGIREKVNAKELGLRRAESVAAFLSTLGVSAERVQVTSFGDALSEAQDYEDIRQARERKVEIWVLR